jgi:hypothetical protein
MPASSVQQAHAAVAEHSEAAVSVCPYEAVSEGCAVANDGVSVVER